MKKETKNTGSTHTSHKATDNKGLSAETTNINRGVTDKVKAKAGRSLSNEGTNTSYEEER